MPVFVLHDTVELENALKNFLRGKKVSFKQSKFAPLQADCGDTLTIDERPIGPEMKNNAIIYVVNWLTSFQK